MKLVNAIKYTNLDYLIDKEQNEIKAILLKEFDMISRLIKNDFNILVHIKTHSPEKRKKYSFHIRLESPTRNFGAESTAWDHKLAVHKAVNKIKNEIKKSQKYANKSTLLKLKELRRISSVIKRK